VPSHAAELPIRNASLTIRISDVAEFEIPRSPGPSMFVVNGDRVGNQLLNLSLQQERFTLSTTATPIDVGPVGGIGLSSVRNDVGLFDDDGADFGGSMPIRGFAWVCLFAPCEFGPMTLPDGLSVALDVIGVGGSTFVSSGDLEVELVGAPWMTGVAQVGSDMESGSIGPAPGGGGFLAVRLVTPIRIETSLDAPNDLIPAFGILAFEVPEPGTLALGLAAVGTLAGVGVSRRRSRSGRALRQPPDGGSGTRSRPHNAPLSNDATR
jgi:hypothetical protein